MKQTVSFPLGRILCTRGALEAMKETETVGMDLLGRHATGDWGEVCPGDWKLNDDAVAEGTRILSAYTLPTGVKIWLITEADRSATTFLLPSEY